jgi:hypothetical protein
MNFSNTIIYSLKRKTKMIYQYATTHTEAAKIAQAAKAAGRRAYVLTLNASCYEIRSW